MPLEREKQGLPLKEFKQKLDNDTYSLRVGREVPEGDVNLAYVHTPKVHVNENLSLINTTGVSDNMIPYDQIESIVAANEEGKLEYVDLIGNDELQPRAPETIFPSPRISLTKAFKKNNFNIDNALYYQFTIKYHYDSKTREPGVRKKYDGQQIELTDENGNPLDDSYNYEIYVTPQINNPRICLVEIYMNMKTNEVETYMVRYNHIDEVRSDNEIQSVQKSVELYSNKANRVLVGGVEKVMMEGSKLRVINSSSAFHESTLSEVVDAQTNNPEAEIYTVQKLANKDGYEIIVPQKAEADPRTKRVFNYRIVASFVNDEGNIQKYSTGYMTDWVINPEALLDKEIGDYSDEWKNIGMPIGSGRLRVEDMIVKSLPPGMGLGVNPMTYEIEDDAGNIIYTYKSNQDNTQVTTHINESMSGIAEARAEGLNEKPWTVAEQENVMLKSNRISHRCSIIAETQKSSWSFTWSITGKGKIKDLITGEQRVWSTSEWKEVKGTGTILYNPDGTFTTTMSPYKLPNQDIENLGVTDIEWNTPLIDSGDDDVKLEVIGDRITASIENIPEIKMVGTPYTIDEDKILKSEGLKILGYVFGENGIYENLNVPKEYNMKDIMLRIERGEVSSNGTPKLNTMEFRVNYRFICSRNGNERMPVDQMNDELGVNRIRLVHLTDSEGNLYDNLSVELAAWTTFEDLEVVPIYGIKVEEDRKLEIDKPQVEEDDMEIDNWYLRVKNGRMYKTIELPFYDEISGQTVPQIYVAYPTLKEYMPNRGEKKEVELEYELPEYSDQEFYDLPKVLIERENPIILNEYAIQTKHYPIALDAQGDSGYVSVESVRGNDSRKLRISDIDAEKGIIYLLDRIREQDIITVRYVYIEEWYTYKGFERIQRTPIVNTVTKKLDLKYNVKMHAEIQYQEVPPTIELNTELEVCDFDKTTVTGSVKHISKEFKYRVMVIWNGETTLIKDANVSGREVDVFSFEIDATKYSRIIDNVVTVKVVATAENQTAVEEKHIILKKCYVNTPPEISITKPESNQWCIDTHELYVIAGTVSHANANFTYTIKANGQTVLSENINGQTEKTWQVMFNAENYAPGETIVISALAIADGFSATDTFTINCVKCTPDPNPINHPYNLKVVFEFGDIVKLDGQEPIGGILDSYAFVGSSRSDFVNYQSRVLQKSSGDIYLDYDRVSMQKVVNGVEQKEISSWDGFEGETATFAIHDFNGFFHDYLGKYSLTEPITLTVYDRRDQQIAKFEIDPALFPINKSKDIPRDFVSAEQKGYLTVCRIKIPADGNVKAENVQQILLPGIQLP